MNKGAKVALGNDDGFMAMHYSVVRGHLAVTMPPVKAGAYLEAKTSHGCRYVLLHR